MPDQGFAADAVTLWEQAHELNARACGEAAGALELRAAADAAMSLSSQRQHEALEAAGTGARLLAEAAEVMERATQHRGQALDLARAAVNLGELTFDTST